MHFETTILEGSQRLLAVNPAGFVKPNAIATSAQPPANCSHPFGVICRKSSFLHLPVLEQQRIFIEG
jgi:hypothetical protein